MNEKAKVQILNEVNVKSEENIFRNLNHNDIKTLLFFIMISVLVTYVSIKNTFIHDNNIKLIIMSSVTCVNLYQHFIYVWNVR